MTAALALLTLAASQALTIRPALADHNDTYTVCPDPVPEGDSARMGIRRSGHKVLEAYAFTDHRYYTADPNDFTEYHGVKFEQSEGSTLWFPIHTTADTRPEHDETFAIGFWDDGVWHRCVVTILDDDAPRILNVELITSPLDLWAYRSGESIDVAVTLDSKVDVEGSPQLALYFGSGEGSIWRGAEYLAGSGTRELLFRYRVQPEDFDIDGVKVGSAATAEDRTPAYGFSGAIYAHGTDVPIVYTHPGIEIDWRQRVDGRPYVRSSRTVSTPAAGRQTYRANEIIEIAFEFNSRVEVHGDVCVELYFGASEDEATKQAVYRSGSGTDTLIFGYTVRPGDADPDGFRLTLGQNKSGFCGDGVITGEGNLVQASPWYRGTGHQNGHRIDTDPPSVREIDISSRPADGGTYAAGETISIEVAFSEHVTVTGSPYVELDIGNASRRATLNPVQGARDKLVFDYEVQSGDIDSDGVSIGANSLNTAVGDIEDRAGNNANTSHAAVAAEATHRVAG